MKTRAIAQWKDYTRVLPVTVKRPRVQILRMTNHLPVSVDDSQDPLNPMRNRLEEIRRLLLAIIPRERGKTMK